MPGDPVHWLELRKLKDQDLLRQSPQKVFLFWAEKSVEVKMQTVLFPISEYWWFYGLFTGFVLLLLAIDLGVFHRKAHAVSFREATTWSIVWIALSLIFNYLLYQYCLWKFPDDPRLTAIAGFVPEAAARQ